MRKSLFLFVSFWICGAVGLVSLFLSSDASPYRQQTPGMQITATFIVGNNATQQAYLAATQTAAIAGHV